MSLRLTQKDLRPHGGVPGHGEDGEQEHLTSLSLRDGDTTPFGCVSHGACPSPDMTIQIGNTVITHIFERTQQVVEVSYYQFHHCKV